MIEQLVARVFATRNAAHLLHWRGPSYAQHVALGEFYDAILDKLDEIVECHQGETGEPIGPVVVLAQPGLDTLPSYISAEEDWICENRNAISDDEAVRALIDELANLYQRASYKLRFLK